MPTRPSTPQFPVSQNNQRIEQKWIDNSSKALRPLGWGRIIAIIQLLIFVGSIFAQEGARSGLEMLNNFKSTLLETTSAKLVNQKSSFSHWDTLAGYLSTGTFNGVPRVDFP